MDGNIIDTGALPDGHAREIAAVRSSTLFDAGFYAAQAPELPPGTDAAIHFCTMGWQAGRKPNPYFDPEFYCARNPDIAALGLNPLVHYIEFGDRESRDPSPMFHARWYRETYGILDTENALADYLARRRTGQVSPVPVFDPAWYLDRNPDVAATLSDPFEHFCAFGVAEARDPAPGFDIAFYQARYATEIGGQNPFLHYLAHRDGGRFLPCRPARERLIAGAVRTATRPSPDFETIQRLPPGAPRLATLLAYYLPQFHPIPENDAWWGQGFTDWTNLARATPRFSGHYQPRVPRDLGYYSLDDPSTLPRQIDLARSAGIAGFVFYYYWFNGRRLLEKPLERLLADPSLDTRFCLMWANENWTRRWDGLEREIMLAQDYRGEDDAALIDDFARHFADPRYIRLDGRPLLMIYRAALIPDSPATIARWRALFAERHGENPLIFMAQSFHDYDPTRHGLDGAVEFPPHKLVVDAPKINAELDLFDPEFTADVYRYDDIAAISLAQPEPAYPLIRTAVPGWDNDPRREGAGVVLHGATPSAYQTWLASLIERARRNPVSGEAIVCINAWNEWAEGACLEPDLHFGAAFLNATGRAASGVDPTDIARNVLLVGHDALAHGAQMLLLHLARRLRRNHGIVPRILLLGGGPLVGAYETEGVVELAPDEDTLARHIALYRTRGIACAIVNSTASARVCKMLADAGIPSTLLVHEMPRIIQEKSLRGVARQGMNAASSVVFSSAFVRDALCGALETAPKTTHVLAQGNYQDIRFNKEDRARFRAVHGIGPDDHVVLGVGFADLRKGFDLFLQVFRLLAAARPDVHFVWVGETHLWVRDYLGTEIGAATATGRFHLLPFDEDIGPAYAAADLYALTSREDPLPTTVIEAMAAGVPAIAFEGSGGIPDLLREAAAGAAVPFGDIAAFANALAERLDHRALAADRARLAKIAAKRFDFDAYARALLGIAHPGLVRISCAVLNYNYRDYLARRLGSVFGQTWPVSEVLLLDDASTDDSPAEARRVAAEWRRALAIHRNHANGGSVLAQWHRAASVATGDFLWLAEADDDADPRFLARLADSLGRAPDAVMAVADSRAIDADGRTVMEDYQRYYIESGVTDLARTGVFPAKDFAARFLSSRNLILNVSAVLFRRSALLAAFKRLGDEAGTWQLAGDWRIYLEILLAGEGSVVWLAEPLNVHRRHDRGLTKALDAERHLAEIARMQDIAAERLGLDAVERRRQAADRAVAARHLGVSSGRT